jgi:hypothetical protein
MSRTLLTQPFDTFTGEQVATPCLGEFDIFDSTNPLDHLMAEEKCLSCPSMPACGATADTSKFTGTWAGRLYIKGKEQPRVCITCARFEGRGYGRCKGHHKSRKRAA